MAEITRIDAKKPMLADRKKVAAYARVSAETDRLEHSLSAQISRYSTLIQSNPEWIYAGVYSDNGISGTGTAKRQGFQEMISDADAGKIDIILTKSISRFARNTVDLLNNVRHLKDIGVEVRFEKEGINTMSADGELMLTILASFAQEESHSISENVKWGTVKRFEQGIPNGHFRIYGYRWEGNELVIQPDEAKIVKLIYNNYLNGMSAGDTEKQLSQMGVKSIGGKHFGKPSIYHILSNVTYTGNLLLQKVYRTSPVNGVTKINHGELAQYLIQNHHEAIIPMETFQKVQEEMAERRKLGVFSNKAINTSCFTSKIKCGCCGMSYRRCTKTKHNGNHYYIWSCRTKVEKGINSCHSKSIPEDKLKRICSEVLHTDGFDEEVLMAQVNQIMVIGADILEFHFMNGTSQQIHWTSKARQRGDRQ